MFHVLIMAILLGEALIAPAHRQQAEALRVEARVAKGTYFVGQAIEVRVGIVAEGERPKVVPPKVDGAEVALIDTTFRQVGASGIGAIVTETNLYTSRFRVIPTRSGPLVIPSFHARVANRSGTSMPIRLSIQTIPAEGRPASYLRGLGRIEAKAEVSPSTVRLGQAFDYRLILNGPGARGSTQWPLLSEFESVQGLRIDQVSTDLVADPPSRSFRYRVRPSLPGDLVLPAVTVATFDPMLRHYVETRSPKVSVRVVDVPRFDSSSLDAVMPTFPEPAPDQSMTRLVGVGLVAVGLGVVSFALWRRGYDRPKRTAIRLARDLRSKNDLMNMADRVATALTVYLETAINRPAGELTPEEARQGVERAVGEGGLAERAGQLIERCARARFGRDPENGSELSVDAADLFDALARKRGR